LGRFVALETRISEGNNKEINVIMMKIMTKLIKTNLMIRIKQNYDDRSHRTPGNLNSDIL
jgi:hypothetical protein